ncbi:MAG: Cof-type HAD-IIB family hydrolase [Lactobacillus sp.]|jgi:Cof subfamily protein (haloacid dehalogenase superfamily)|nr:Cof-type HAD-IIB family hydrolase [Lactobacillus sp.]MCH3906017.1 Cof-type HAD-IIB family hydrolase [Lactobacillus sp.]MCH3990409.1 Cof-type HAD-IIB family hydrolase [Lactobacillus sp.]MCH4068876.1 Cof-type HAD-IIB family hydrolase [Lactobacillus sp.]MCI1303278.1 Cof-type HAD-IIB family hydrolase [Lactobacillus sp.]
MDLKQIKLIAIDVDGTLVDAATNQITSSVVDAVKRARSAGIRIVICSGRAFTGIKPWLAKMDMLTGPEEYAVCYGGGLVMSTHNRILLKKLITYDDYLDLEYLSRKLGLHFHASGLNNIYTANRNIGKWSVREASMVKTGLCYRTPEEMKGIDIFKGMFIDDPEILEPAIADQTPFKKLSDRLTFVRTLDSYYEGLPKGVDKSLGLQKLSEVLQIKPAEMMAIGDEINDLPMMKYAACGVAMGNARQSVKDQADLVTSSVQEDGVAKVIDQVLAAQGQ